MKVLDVQTAEERLNSPDNLANRFGNGSSSGSSSNSSNPQVTVLPFRPKSPNQNRRLPVEIRDTVTALSRMGENQPALAKEFGVTQSDVSALKRNRKSDKVDEMLGEVRDVALGRLMKSMGLMDDDKLAACTAPQLASVASSMSKVVQETLPKQLEQMNTTNLVIYAPQVKTEAHYEIQKV